jgi:hypothetical protein
MGEWENGRSRRRRDTRCSTSNGGRGEQTWERWMRDPPRTGRANVSRGTGESMGGDLEETMETSDGRRMSRDVVEGSSERWVNGEWRCEMSMESGSGEGEKTDGRPEGCEACVPCGPAGRQALWKNGALGLVSLPITTRSGSPVHRRRPE